MNRFTVAVIFSLLMATPLFSQERDTVMAVMNSDSIFRFGEGDFPVTDIVLEPAVEVKSPTRALMLALILPGLGQAYNEKYYKIPIVWAAMGGVGYAISFNTKEYKAATINYIRDENDLNKKKLEFWKRNMELSYIATILVYGLQILDAYVDANLYSWNVSNNLSMGISPSLQPMMTQNSLTGFSGGLTCSLKIRGR
jgi:hypothetical protein